MDGLWTKNQPTTAQLALAAHAHNLEEIRQGFLPGTWLQLSPVTSPKTAEEKWLSLSHKTSPLPSPAVHAAVSPAEVKEDLALSMPNAAGFLTNAGAAHRSSSVSSNGSIQRRALGSNIVTSYVDEREAIGLTRFLRN